MGVAGRYHDQDYFGGDEEQPPPPFTQGSFSDPVLEKVNSAVAQREMYEGGASVSAQMPTQTKSQSEYWAA